MNENMDYITAGRKEVEQTLRYLTVIAERAMEGIVVFDLSGVLRFVNAAWATMHGYEAGHELIGKQISIFHTKEQMKTDVIPFIEEVKGRGQLAGPMEHVRRDGTPLPTDMLMVIFKGEAGKAMGLIGFATDLTEHERTKNELKRYRNCLAELVKQQTVELTAANEQLQNQIAEHERAEQRLKQQTAELTAANEQLQDQIAEHERAEQHLKQQTTELTAANEQIQDQIAERERAEQRLKQQTDELTAANEQIQDQIAEHERAEQRLKQQTAELTAANEQQLQKQIAEHERAEQHLKQQTAELTAANEQLQDQIAEDEQAEQRLKQQTDELTAANEQFQDQIAEHERAEEHLKQQTDQLKAANEQLRYEALEHERAEQHLKQQTEKLKAATERLKDQINELSTPGRIGELGVRKAMGSLENDRKAVLEKIFKENIRLQKPELDDAVVNENTL
ncbi:MAG: PAS domain-containing protein [Planctomycetota bacterium]|jgi:PAS domain S-box-containing protein